MAQAHESSRGFCGSVHAFVSGSSTAGVGMCPVSCGLHDSCLCAQLGDKTLTVPPTSRHPQHESQPGPLPWCRLCRKTWGLGSLRVCPCGSLLPPSRSLRLCLCLSVARWRDQELQSVCL